MDAETLLKELKDRNAGVSLKLRWLNPMSPIIETGKNPIKLKRPDGWSFDEEKGFYRTADKTPEYVCVDYEKQEQKSSSNRGHFGPFHFGHAH